MHYRNLTMLTVLVLGCSPIQDSFQQDFPWMANDDDVLTQVEVLWWISFQL